MILRTVSFAAANALDVPQGRFAAVVLSVLCVAVSLGACSDDDPSNPSSSTSTSDQTSTSSSSTTTQATTSQATTTQTTTERDAELDTVDVEEDTPDDTPPEDVVEDADAAPECENDALRCATQDRIERCTDGRWVEEDCEEDTICTEDACRPRICTPQDARCVDDATVGVCNATGTFEEAFPCPEGLVCEGARCVSDCQDGETRCEGATVQRCNAETGEFEDVEVCAVEEELVCRFGECIPGCASDGSKKYFGCDFWGVDTPNEFGLPNVFAFVVGNVNAERSAEVRVEDIDGRLLAQATVPPQDVATLEMPQPRAFNNPSTGLRRTGFRLLSDIPVTAYQFNPLQQVDNEVGVVVSSNDASLLLPDSALGNEYIVASYTHWNGPFGYASFVSIVSVEDGNTITVTPSASVAAGVGVPDPIAPGETRTFALNRGEVLTFSTTDSGQDLTGTHIESTSPVSVIGGVDCAQIPVGETFCDHIEETIPPVSSWGSEYFAAKFKVRGEERDIWRIVASQDDTLILTEPNQFGGDDVLSLNRGEYHDFYSRDAFRLLANAPVLLVQYMTGSRTVPPEGEQSTDGDPSMLVSVPLRQFRTEYIFLVPNTYERDWITVVFPEGEVPILDGAPIDLDLSESFDVAGWRYAYIPVSDGRHRMVADSAFGVSVYGYDRNISYAYPAGLDLNELTPDDEE